MVHITYYHARYLFKASNQSLGFLNSYEGIVMEFEGYEFDLFLPTVKMTFQEFDKVKNLLPFAEYIVGIRTSPTILQYLSLGVRPIDNQREDMIKKAKIEYSLQKEK